MENLDIIKFHFKIKNIIAIEVVKRYYSSNVGKNVKLVINKEVLKDI